MSLSASPSGSQPFIKRPALSPAFKKPSRWYLPLMGAIALGFGVANYYETQARQSQFNREEEERLRKNRALMDAYGDKETVQDIERALVFYDLQ
ncbi:hypothetical protein AbraIFM66951_000496 [Aspergillus brasiliensis]|uniref:Uncharacterized protein n=2 Tax=Aspergillus brasiliensis TaxID=319629 RepID=A0A1L9UBK6_ASPBC|nr:hypothetical protein ASPBRDRAFT_183501 [Aspergillus brasiliensis CBS 101740]GKZ25038.1 hypothetical protein AbraCBS73388_000475 [Aspergillus brasiliensis]GKZ38555.1 hypothetical protein AbraIFM66950_010837 [Aspergillus brasiliensis]GKZ48435.1 hypothetical protein AbraIFM66951_000496 [Aspergillus brasiliensis]